MNNEIFEIKFTGRQLLTKSQRNWFYLSGIAQIGIGLWGLFQHLLKDETLMFSYILIPTGLFSIFLGIFGKTLRSETNFFSANQNNITYKNSGAKSKTIQLNNIQDIIISKSAIEFISTNEKIYSYNYSPLSKRDSKKLTEKITNLRAFINEKSSHNKKQLSSCLSFVFGISLEGLIPSPNNEQTLKVIRVIGLLIIAIGISTIILGLSTMLTGHSISNRFNFSQSNYNTPLR